MHKLFVTFAALGVVAAPAMAQNAQAAQAPTDQAQTAPTEKPKTVKKLVCREVDEERGIGSRLASTTKICRTVEVPAPPAKPGQNPQGETSAH
jgi:hypothetical protein